LKEKNKNSQILNKIYQCNLGFSGPRHPLLEHMNDIFNKWGFYFEEKDNKKGNMILFSCNKIVPLLGELVATKRLRKYVVPGFKIGPFPWMENFDSILVYFYQF
jgi:hypothetical protein